MNNEQKNETTATTTAAPFKAGDKVLRTVGGWSASGDLGTVVDVDLIRGRCRIAWERGGPRTRIAYRFLAHAPKTSNVA